MILKKLRPRPTKAGITKLVFEDCEYPRREGDVISLPNEGWNHFFPLLGGEQFVFADSHPNGQVRSVWFGGTDEQPFLTQLTTPPMRKLQRGGERCFFASLKPRLMIQIEEALGVTAQRQGDIWYVPIPATWEQLIPKPRKRSLGERCTALFTRRKAPTVEPLDERLGIQDVDYFEKGRMAVWNTQHRIQGQYVSVKVFGVETEIGEGVLTAPDHEPRELVGPHVFAQTAHLKDPDYPD